MAFLMHQDGRSLRTIQPYFTFSSGGSYHVKVVQNSPISHFYTFQADLSDGSVIAVPDASIDILFLCDEDQSAVRLCGSTTAAKLVEIKAGKRYFGVRFHPGKIPRFIESDFKALIDGEIPLQDLITDGDELLEKVANSGNFEDRIHLFMHHFLEEINPNTPEFGEKIHQLITKNAGALRINDISEYIGFSTRYINRVFTESFGLSPKTYSLILRFQHILQQMLLDDAMSLTDLASDQGYADQSHFFREFKKFTTLAPSKFMQKASLNQYQGYFV